MPPISWLPSWTQKNRNDACSSWLFDLARVAKVRLVFEISIDVAFLKPGAFLVQNVATYQNARAIRKLGVLTADQFATVFKGLLGLPGGGSLG